MTHYENLNFEGPNENYVKKQVVTSLESYKALFDGVSDEVAIGEGSTSYLYIPSAASRIKHHIPNVKLIAILRDPVEGAFSYFLDHIHCGIEPLNIEKFMMTFSPKEIEHRKNWSPFWKYSEMRFYYFHLRRFYDLFNAKQIKIYLYEDFVSKPEGILKDIFVFLGVNSDYSVEMSERHNVKKLVKNNTLANAFKSDNFYKSFVKKVLPSKAVYYLSDKFLREPKPKLKPEVRKKLIEVYQEDIFALQELIQRDLSAWFE